MLVKIVDVIDIKFNKRGIKLLINQLWLGLLKSCIYVCLINYFIYIIILQMIEEYIQNMRMYK